MPQPASIFDDRRDLHSVAICAFEFQRASIIMSEDRKRDYEVGYRKPPLHSRFKSGQSANPAGRKKGVPNFKTDVETTLHLPVQLSEAGKTKRVSTQQAALSRLKQKALNGDRRALDRALKLASKLGDEAESSGLAGPMDAVDQAILTAFVEEVLSPRRPPAPDQDIAAAPLPKGSNT
jgi:hypothetical protein